MNQRILDESYPIIEKLAKTRSANGSFAYFEKDDVYQEIWCMCLEALKRYDPSIGPIENYLVTHVTNRTKNLKRDKYFRPGFDHPTSGLAKTRMNIVNALPLDNENITEEGFFLWSTQDTVNPPDRLSCNETVSHIRENLPEHLLESFDDLLGNNKVRYSIIQELREEITKILSESNNDIST